MKRWSEEMVAAFEACDQSSILTMLNMGFPANTPMRKKTATGRVLIARTFCCHLAAEYGFVDVLKTLVELNTDIELEDSFGRTPLLIAADIGQLPAFQFLLHEAHSKPTARDLEGNTALHLSSLNSHLRLVQYLIETVRFPIHLKNAAGLTALEACERKHEHSGTTVQSALDGVIAFLSSVKQSGYRSVPLLVKSKGDPKPVTKSIHRHCIHRFQQAEWAKDHGIKVEDARKADAGGHKLTFQLVAHESLAPMQTKYQTDMPVDKNIQTKCQEIYDRFVGSRVIYIDKEEKKRFGYAFPVSSHMGSTTNSRVSTFSLKTRSVM